MYLSKMHRLAYLLVVLDHHKTRKSDLEGDPFNMSQLKASDLSMLVSKRSHWNKAFLILTKAMEKQNQTKNQRMLQKDG